MHGKNWPEKFQRETLQKQMLMTVWATQTSTNQKGRIGEASNPGPVTKKTLTVQQVNITQLDKNGHFIVKNAADITGIAEHKLKKCQVCSWKQIFKDARKTLACGPSDYSRKVPQAGVGISTSDRVKLVEAEIKAEAFKTCYEQGRVYKAYVECGWLDSIVVYETYCEAGGTNKAKEHNVAILDAIRGEMVGEETTPP